MSLTAPNSDIYLLKTPIELDSNNQLDFINATAQQSYFNGCTKINISEATFQRKDGKLRYPGNSEALLDYNYCMYRNKNHGNKWFYAFVTKVEYLSENSSAISLKTDPWQTYMFDLTFKPCLIDREHTNDDTTGANTLPEGLEIGEPVLNAGTVDFGPNATDQYYSDNYWIVADVSMIENEGESSSLSYRWTSQSSHDPKPVVNGLPSGCFHLLLGKYSQQGAYDTTIKDLTDAYDLAGLGDAIVSIYIIPKSIIPLTYYGLEITGRVTAGTQQGSFKTLTVAVPQASWKATDIGDATFTTRTTLNSYTPRNHKLLTYPYSYFNISNNAGTTLPYRYEDFSNGVKFKVLGALCPSGSVKVIPDGYKKAASGNIFDYGITGPKYPMCSWINDSYTNWLTQNAVNMETQWKVGMLHAAGNLVSSIGSYATVAGAGGAGIGAAVGAIQGVKDYFQIAREQHLAKTQANLTPDASKGNMNAGDVIWAQGRSRFTFMPMCIKEEYARCIDEYFDQYGYKSNRVKYPNITGRTNWNFVKTVGCNVIGNAPQDAIAEIKSYFDSGITIWHNPSTFLDYSQSNAIVS